MYTPPRGISFRLALDFAKAGKLLEEAASAGFGDAELAGIVHQVETEFAGQRLADRCNRLFRTVLADWLPKQCPDLAATLDDGFHDSQYARAAAQIDALAGLVHAQAPAPAGGGQAGNAQGGKGYDPDAYMPVKEFRDKLAEKHGGTDFNTWTKIKKANLWIRFDPEAKEGRPRIHRADADKLLSRLDPDTWELLDEGDHPSVAGSVDKELAEALMRKCTIRQAKKQRGG